MKWKQNPKSAYAAAKTRDEYKRQEARRTIDYRWAQHNEGNTVQREKKANAMN